MTRLERKQAELDRMYECKAAAQRRSDMLWLLMNKEKIDALEAEIAEMRKYEPQRLGDLIADRDESVKNDIYKSLLRISLLSDAVNESVFICREILQKYGIDDFTFRQKVEKLNRLSHEIANIPLMAKGKLMEDMMVNNSTFVRMCIKHADAHLKRTLKL